LAGAGSGAALVFTLTGVAVPPAAGTEGWRGAVVPGIGAAGCDLLPAGPITACDFTLDGCCEPTPARVEDGGVAAGV